MRPCTHAPPSSQYRHFLSLIDIFKLKPSKDSKEFGDLAMFMAQVRACNIQDHSACALTRTPPCRASSH